jgi:hypothetical protein
MQTKKSRKPPAIRSVASLQPSTSSTLEAPVADPVTATEEPAAATASIPGCSDAIAVEHSYVTYESPRKLKRKLNITSDKFFSLRKKLKIERQRTHRLKKRVTSLQTVVDNLHKQNLVNDTCVELLEGTYSGVPLAVMKRIVLRKGKTVTHKAYPPELRAFALTLQFYSTKVYNYVRQHFSLALPSLSAIKRWYQSVNGDPGFIAEAFAALQARAGLASSKNKPLLCSLMIDEM